VTANLSPSAARRVFLTLTFTRWFPVGLIVGITTLWPLERGLTVAQTLAAASLTGITVFALELPTSGFADAFGRRPVYVASAVVSVVAGAVFYTATAWWQFAVAAVLTGVFRALDSGPSRRGSSTPSTRASPRQTSTEPCRHKGLSSGSVWQSVPSRQGA